MSLKAFHIFFVLVSTLLTLGFAAWSLQGYASGGGAVLLLAAGASMIACIGLIVYGIRFLKKLKNVSFI